MSTSKHSLLVSLPLVLAVVGCSRTPVRDALPTNDRPAEVGKTYSWTFDDGGAFTGTLPLEPPRHLFFTVLGRWDIASEKDAPSLPNVYRQEARLGAQDSPRVLVGALSFAGLSASVKCRPEGRGAQRSEPRDPLGGGVGGGAPDGEREGACGIAFRVEGADDYYAVSIDPRGPIELAKVEGGVKTTLGTATLPPEVFAQRGFRALRVAALMDDISVFVDSVRVIDARDETFREGKLGLFTGAGSSAAFDDLEATAIEVQTNWDDVWDE
jgi:hypothetical protein